MESVETILRVAGVVVTLLMALLMLRDARLSLVGWLGALFSLGVAAYLVCSAPAFHGFSPYVHFPILAVCVSNPAL